MRFRKTSLWVKLMILALVVCATAMLISLQSQIQQAKAENVEKQQQLTALTQSNEKMKSVNDDMATYQAAYQSAYTTAARQAEEGEEVDEAQIIAGIDSEAMADAAREQGYVNPDEIIFEDINN